MEQHVNDCRAEVANEQDVAGGNGVELGLRLFLVLRAVLCEPLEDGALGGEQGDAYGKGGDATRCRRHCAAGAASCLFVHSVQEVYLRGFQVRMLHR